MQKSLRLSLLLSALFVFLALANATSAMAQYAQLWSFPGNYLGPQSGLSVDAVGNLFGATAGFWGTLFEFKRTSNGTFTYSQVYTFDGDHGGLPYAAPIADAAGNLYGTAAQSGKCGRCGVVYKLTPNTQGGWNYSVLHAFTDGNDGGSPRGGLIFDSVGTLYGAAESGGTYGTGVIFELKLSGSWWRYKVLHSFGGDFDGEAPLTGLVFDKAGNLYGTTMAGGSHGLGTVFKLTHQSAERWKCKVLYTLQEPAGITSTESGLMAA